MKRIYYSKRELRVVALDLALGARDQSDSNEIIIDRAKEFENYLTEGK